MILIVFENDTFPLSKQHPSGMENWEKHDIDSVQVLPKQVLTIFYHNVSIKKRLKKRKQKILSMN